MTDHRLPPTSETDHPLPRPEGALARAAARAGYITLDDAATLLALAMRDPSYTEEQHMVTLHLTLDVFLKTFELVQRHGPMSEASGHRLVFSRADPPTDINDYFELRVLGPDETGT